MSVATRKLLPSVDADRANCAVSIIVPAYNEESRIGATLEDIASAMPTADIIVVLNGCTDGTLDVVETARRKRPNIRYITIAAPVGKGGAIRAGVLASNAEVIAYVDADGATSGAELRRLVSLLGDADALIASRWISGADIGRAQPLARRIVSRGFNFLVRGLFGLPFSDTQCGAKLFRASVLKEVVEQIETSTLAIDVDILYALHRQGRVVREVPTTWNDVDGSKINIPKSSFQMLLSVLRLRLKHSLLRYAVPLFDHFFPTSPIAMRSKLNILICNWRDVHHPQAGGAETYLHEQAKRWVALGHRVEWLTGGFAGGSKTETIDGVNVMRVGNRLTLYLAAPIMYLTKLRDRYDIIVDAENGIPFFTPLFSLKRKKLLIFHVHRGVFLKYLPAPISWLFVWIETWLMPKIYAGVDVITISEDSKSDIERFGITKRPIEVIRSGVDSRLVPGPKSETPLISYVGRLRAYKRVDWLLHAFVQIRAAVPDARLKIAGAGDDLDRLVALARELGIAGACDFCGFVSEEEKCRLLQRSWVFVSPSSMEGWGIAALEANACGTPVVVFDVPGLREAVSDGVSGKVLRDRDELAGAVVQVLTNRVERQRLERGGICRAANFSWDETARQTLDVLIRDAAATHHSLMLHEGHWLLVSRELTKSSS